MAITAGAVLSNLLLATASVVFVPIWILLVTPHDERLEDLRERIHRSERRLLVNER